MRTIIIALLLTVLPASLAAQEPATRHLQLEDYLDWEWVADPQLSPRGSQILYTRSHVDRMNDRRVSEVWLMNADGSRKRFLVEGSGARWSPDGTRIAFVEEGAPAGAQIFVRWMDAEGAVSQVTRLEESPRHLRWSPDGERIAFVMNVADEEDFTVQPPGRPEGADWTESPKVVTRMTYKADRRGYTDEGHAHIFVVDAEGGTPRRLTSGPWDHGGAEWMPDGRELVFSSLRTEDADRPEHWYESEVYAVDVQSGGIRQLTTRRGPDDDPVPAPDGRLIAFTGADWNDDTYRNESIYVMRPDGSDVRLISRGFDRAPGTLMWAADGSGVYFDARTEGTMQLFFAAADGGVRQLTDGTHVLRLGSVDRQGNGVGVLEAPHAPGDVVAFRLDRPQQRNRLTAVNDDVLNGVALGEVEEIWYDSKDGLRIQGWIVRPPDFDPDRDYPMMLAIHGGPHAMYDVGFNFGWQEHAANGYVVLYTNPRGSTGYGSPFANAIKNAYPGDDYDDLMNGVDALLDRGYVDPDRLYVYGCSGGGILTSWIVGHTDRFAAASANCPVTNWISLLGTSDAYRYHRNFQNWFWEDPSEHLRRSPIMYVGNVSTPTMLMTGENDLRTPMPQTEEYYQALQVRGVPTVMVRFQNEWHGTTSRPSNFMRTQLFLRKWFERWAGGETVAAGDGDGR